VVAGSNPATPTIESYLKSPKSVNKNSSKTVNNKQFAATFLKRLSSVQLKLRLSDRALAKKLSISNAYLSYIKRGQREITPAFIQKASVLPGLESFAAEKSNISVSVCTYIEGMEIRDKPNIQHFIEDFLIAKQARVKELEGQINKMVYELYGLTPEEIEVVEGNSGS
jgi:transcriptional regulator with XRE-family HTH domain